MVTYVLFNSFPPRAATTRTELTTIPPPLFPRTNEGIPKGIAGNPTSQPAEPTKPLGIPTFRRCTSHICIIRRTHETRLSMPSEIPIGGGIFAPNRMRFGLAGYPICQTNGFAAAMGPCLEYPEGHNWYCFQRIWTYCRLERNSKRLAHRAEPSKARPSRPNHQWFPRMICLR